MGGGVSAVDVPDRLTVQDCKLIMGPHFDAILFENIATGGVVTKDMLLDAIARRTDCFLTHDWGKELGMDNHARVAMVNDALKKRGLKTWFDQEQVIFAFINCKKE